MTATQDALDMMTAAVMNRKDAAGTKLTPVGMEAHALPRTSAPFPNDVPDEAIEQRVLILEELFDKMAAADERIAELYSQVHVQYAAIRETMDVVKRTLRVNSPAAPDAAVAAKEKERAADAAQTARKAARPVVASPDTGDDDGLEAALAASLTAVNEAPTIDAAVEEVAKFNREFAAKSAAAQAAVFAKPVVTAATPDGWVCPTHGGVEYARSRLGRTYPKCPEAGCAEFRKLA